MLNSVSKEEMLDTLEHCRLTMTYHEVQALAGKWNKHDEEVVQAIRDLVVAEPEKGQPKVSREWVNRRINEAKSLGMTDTDAEYFVFALLKESGVEVEE